MSRNRFKTLALALLMAAFLAPLSACYWYVGPGGVSVSGGDVFYVDEMHHQRVHSYYYYPDAGVYFDPLGVYYWREGDVWRHDRRLPGHIRLHEGERRAFRSDASRPYDVHGRVSSRFSHGGHESGRPEREHH